MISDVNLKVGFPNLIIEENLAVIAVMFREGARSQGFAKLWPLMSKERRREGRVACGLRRHESAACKSQLLPLQRIAHHTPCSEGCAGWS